MENGRIKLTCATLAICFLMSAGCASSPSSTEVAHEGDAGFHNTMGMAFLKEGKMQLAYVEFQKALQLDSDHRDANYNLGLTCFQLEDYENSMKYFLKVTKIAPDFPDGHNNLGVSYMQLGKWSQAAESFSRAIANPIYQTPELAYYSLGLAMYRMGQYVKAVDSFKDSIRRDRKFALPYYGMALAYNKLGRYGEAAEVLERAIQLDTQFQGDREKKLASLKERLFAVRGEEERDVRDFLDIMQY